MSNVLGARVELTVRSGWGLYRPGEESKVTGVVVGRYSSPQGFGWVIVRPDSPARVGYLEHPLTDLVHVSAESPHLKILRPTGD